MENKAPGPNGFPMNVFKVFWGVIGGDVMGAMKEFHKKKKSSSMKNPKYIFYCSHSQNERR